MTERVALADAADNSIFIETAAANVRRGKTLVHLTGRERELAVATAVQTQPASTEVLGRLLYPDRDDDEGSNIVKVYVYRLRQRIAANFIVWRDGGYVVGADVRVDITLARTLLDELSRESGLPTTAEREDMLSLARGLRAESPAPLLDREWYEPISRRARRLGHELAILLGRIALEARELHDALRIGQELTYEDPCDEEAWELLIRAQLLLGQHIAAIQGFRFYEAALARELATAPSAQMRQLLNRL